MLHDECYQVAKVDSQGSVVFDISMGFCNLARRSFTVLVTDDGEEASE